MVERGPPKLLSPIEVMRKVVNIVRMTFFRTLEINQSLMAINGAFM